MIDLQKIIGFDWDHGNARKNDKHVVSAFDAEQVFANEPLLLLDDSKHSEDEARYHALGKTDEGRTLHVTFTLRSAETLLRIISARDMSRMERKIYEQRT